MAQIRGDSSLSRIFVSVMFVFVSISDFILVVLALMRYFLLSLVCPASLEKAHSRA